MCLPGRVIETHWQTALIVNRPFDLHLIITHKFLTVRSVLKSEAFNIIRLLVRIRFLHYRLRTGVSVQLLLGLVGRASCSSSSSRGKRGARDQPRAASKT